MKSFLTRLVGTVAVLASLAAVIATPAASAQANLVAPASCTFTRSGDLATIDFTPAANDGADRYVVQRNRNYLGWFWAARVWDGNPTVATNAVSTNDSVEFRVLSRNPANDISDPVNCMETGSLVAPRECTFSRTGDEATVTWTPAPNDGANRYIVQRQRTSNGTEFPWGWQDRIDVGEPNEHVNDVVASDDVQFRIRSRNSADEWSSPRLCREVDPAPLTPTSCTFMRSGNAVDLAFTAAANDGANRYVIERNRNGLGWFWVGRVFAGNPLEFSDSVNAADDVAYRVRSRNAANFGSSQRYCTETFGDGFVSQGRWEFEQTTGPVLDSVGSYDGTAGVGSHAGDLVRRGGAARFSGRLGSIVVVDVSGAPAGDFNPAGDELRWSVEFSMTAASLTRILSQTGPSWNLMQRGFANNPGGQWKTQIIVRSNQVFAQCVVRDGQGGELLQRSTTPIVAGERHTISCHYDDAAEELVTTFDDTVEPPKPAPAGFGDVDPTGTAACGGGSGSLGDAITIGNKPGCGNVDANDKFIGSVFEAEVEKR